MVSKDELRKKFTVDWEKHYKVDILLEKGFERKKCKITGKYFWTLDSDREVCAEPEAVGYQFIGEKTKNYDYVQTWKEVEKYMVKHGHESISRYPTVCRWRNDLYFTAASIIDFQPYVVTGELPPPANPLIVPQASLRFVDINNVGVSGRHYTSFIMFGQHAFNSKETGTFYWKDEALEHDYNLLTKVLGIEKEEVIFHEDVWAGGGTFGPCIEYFVKGLELGNCVFMQFQDLGKGKYKELDTKVIDMGAGLERFAWYTTGTPTSYETTFGPVIQQMKKDYCVEYDEKVFLEYAKHSGTLNADEVDLRKEKELVAKKLGMSEEQLFGMLKPLQVLYAIADHLKTILYTSTDGMLPSNSGGGYNLRLILRRIFGFNDEFNFDLDYYKIIKGHAEYLKTFDPTLMEGIDTTANVVEEEQKKFASSREKAGRRIEIIAKKVKKENKKLSFKEMRTLYESNGIPYELIEEYSKKMNFPIEQVDNFYGMLQLDNEKKEEEKKYSFDVSSYPKTKMLFYENQSIREFDSKVIGIEGKYVILDKTALYAEGGGQSTDHGFLDGVKVIDVQKIEGIIVHEVENIEKFSVGKKVFGEVDWFRRTILMKQHTGAHLLNAAARKVLGIHIWQAGSHKDIDKAHLDLTHYKRITDSQLEKIELLVNKYIQDLIPVSAKFYNRVKAEKEFGFRLYQGGYVPGKDIRIINVENLEVEACGGTHVSNTGEIGVFKIIKREGIKDGIERVVYTTGIPAIQFIQEKERQISKSSKIMGVPEKSLVLSVNRFFSEWKEQRKQLALLQEKMAAYKFDELEKKVQNGFASEYFEGINSDYMVKSANNFVLKNPQVTVLFSNELGEIVILKGEKSTLHAKEIFNKLAKIVDVKGGGNDKMFRGKTNNVLKLKNSEMLSSIIMG